MASDAGKPGVSSAEMIFTAALELSPTERSVYLARVCGDDQQLRLRVERLLRAHEAPEGFLPEKPANVPASSLTEQPGDLIDQYKLREKIGEGGCGVVYMAEQEEPVRRRVALKIIKLGMDTKQVVARFEAERQALAMMDHANIAKVLDAGATDTGRPYFAMELVGGIKITEYCDHNQLTIRQRLDLFIQVCRAIQHAHQKGVIHRDIKPSNVLVATQDGMPIPKVIDFGIAKATQGRLTDQTIFTAFEQFIGTPAYMSPEQAQLGGLDVDTRSDIYSLGVLLYELLTGKTPFDSKELLAAGLEAMRRTIQEKEPPTPSTRLKQETAARLASSEKSALNTPQSALDKDLDWIVMKCLEKDRARRYETANGLAMDIERHLNSEPIVARPPSNYYRFRKLVRRNKLAFTAASSVVAALTIGFAVSLWMFLEEKQARQRAVAAENIQRRAVQRAEIAERSAEAEASELAQALYKLGDLSQAEKFVRESLTAKQRLLGNDHVQVAHWLDNLGFVLCHEGKAADAENFHRDALALHRKLLGDRAPELGRSWWGLGIALQHQGKLTEAEDAFNHALTCLQDKSETEGSDDNPSQGTVLPFLADVLLERHALAKAHSVAERAVALYDRHPDWSLNGRQQAVRVRDAILARSSGVREKSKTNENPGWRLATNNVSAQPSIAFLRLRSSFLAQQGHWKEAAADCSKLIETNPTDHLLYFQLATLLVADEEYDAYRKLTQRILEQFGRTFDAGVADKMAKACLILPSPETDFAVAGRLAEIAVTNGQSKVLMGYFQCTKGLCEYRQGHFRSAADWVQKGLDSGRTDHYVKAMAYAVLSMAYYQLKQFDSASAALERGMGIINGLPDASSGYIGDYWADWIIAQSLTDEARALIQGRPVGGEKEPH